MIRRWLLSRFFDLLYTRLAWAYDAVAWAVSAGQWYRWTRAALPFVGAGPVLEVGCGRGRLLRSLAARGKVVGVDGSMQMARAAAQHSGAPVLRGDGRALPFPDGHFGTLVTTFPAPYVLDPATQREFARVVRPGGRWLWVDAPALEPVPGTMLARAITRVAQGDWPDHPLWQERSGGLWRARVERVAVGPTSVAVRVATRTATAPPTARAAPADLS